MPLATFSSPLLSSLPLPASSFSSFPWVPFNQLISVTLLLIWRKEKRFHSKIRPRTHSIIPIRRRVPPTVSPAHLAETISQRIFSHLACNFFYLHLFFHFLFLVVISSILSSTLRPRTTTGTSPAPAAAAAAVSHIRRNA